MAVLRMDAEGHGQPLSAKDLAEQQALPAELLGKVLQALARTGVIVSAHGAHGGYRLARPLETISLGEMVEAIDGPVRLVKCQDDPCACDLHDGCTIRDPVMRIQQQLLQYLFSFNLADFRSTTHGRARWPNAPSIGIK